MKFLISTILLVCSVATTYAMVPEQFVAKLEEFKGDCIKESGVDAKLIEEIEKMMKEHRAEHKRPTPEEMKPFDTKEAKCFAKCMAIKFGIVNEKGEVQYDNISKTFDLPADSEVMKLIKQCAEANKQDDLCERVATTKMCMMKALHDKRH